MGRLAHKRVLVTAAGQGIGRACAELFHHEQAQIYATDIDDRGLKELADLGVLTIKIDGTDAVAVHDFLAGTEVFDAVVHCIGTVHDGTVVDCDADSWQRSFSVNVDSFYYLLQGVLPKMRTAGRGSIVCIASVASSVKGLPRRAAYGATKAATIGLVKSVAADFVADGIRCNAVCPGTIISPSLLERVDTLGRDLGNNGQAMAAFVARQPMGRLGTAEEVAALCLYLASDESMFVTGQALSIDGGMTI